VTQVDELYAATPVRSTQGQIRLLYIQPDSDFDTLLTCEVKLHCFNDSLLYATLSYAWDSSIFEKQLSCNGIVITVTSSLHYALRRYSEVNPGLPLWADQICIYQDRYRSKCCRNLRFEPQFCEGVGFAHLACRIGSTNRSPFVILSHSLARLERMRSNIPPTKGAESGGGWLDMACPVLAGEPE
jgi:hypothetical protein